MSFLKKLFGGNKKPNDDLPKKDPENTRLIYLLDNWEKNPSKDNYHAVVDEVLNGNSFLLLPSVNDRESSMGWETIEKGMTLNLTCVFNIDGLKVLAAFSDENALVAWSKTQTQYTALSTKEIVNLCAEQGIDRVVINSDQKNMFVLERNRENITSRKIEEDTKVLVGSPMRPFDKHIIDNLVASFKKVDTIEEAYHYAQTMKGEHSLVLGIKMSVVSDNSRAALYNAINSVLSDKKFDLPVDVMILETDEWLQTVRGIEDSLFYKR